MKCNVVINGLKKKTSIGICLITDSYFIIRTYIYGKTDFIMIFNLSRGKKSGHF